GGEREAAGQYLVQDDAEGIQIAPRVDRPVHPPGLLGGHVRERARDDLGRLGRLPLAAKSRRDPEAGEPDSTGRRVDKDVGRRDVLVDQTGSMHALDRARETDCQLQKGNRVNGLAEQAGERHAAGVLERQNRATLVPAERDRACRPSRIELGGQRIFVLEARERCGRRVVTRRREEEHTGTNVARGARVRSAVQDELPIPLEWLERAVREVDHAGATDSTMLEGALTSEDFWRAT